MICSFLGSASASIESQRQSLLSVRLPNWLPPSNEQLQVFYLDLHLLPPNEQRATASLLLGSRAKYEQAARLLQAPVCCQECWQEAQLSICLCTMHTVRFCKGIVWRGQLSIWPVHSVDWSRTPRASVGVQSSRDHVTYMQASVCWRESKSQMEYIVC